MTNIWLDDIRATPLDGRSWHPVQTARGCIKLLISAAGNVATLSLDHDLGEGDNALLIEDPGTGYDVAKWLEEQASRGNYKVIPQYILCHSANPVGRKRILQAIDRINKYREEAQ